MKKTAAAPVTGPQRRTMHRTALLATLLLATIPFFSSQAAAKVSGPCSNCHTMHNSEDGVALDPGGPNSNLLTGDCVGCHSSDTADTIVNGVPIVYNTVAPTDPLAGGNFYWVSRGGASNDVYGHNVWGISGEDNNITADEGAPGNSGGPGCVGCHQSLATDPAVSAIPGKSGCQGCHTEVSHHDDSNNWFRFLKGHMSDDHYVTGIEAVNWEQDTANTNDRNIYRGIDEATFTLTYSLRSTHSITAFCSGCHTDFHEYMGTASPWIRHPNDILLPETGEYGAYDPLTTYSNEAPVAYLDPDAPVRAEAVVTCLSCHRAHGSDQPDMLRWDYSNMAVGTGCFTCHTNKD